MVQFEETKNSRPSPSDIYAFAEKKGILLGLGLVTQKDLHSFVPSITYRKLNVWDAKGLITSSREKSKGWRKFSLIDIIKIQIVSDLRQFGCGAKTIKAMLYNLLKKSMFNANKDGSKRTISGLEYSVFASMLGEKTLLLVDNQSNSTLLPEDEAVKTYFLTNNAPSPILILPFYSYVEKIVNTVKAKVIIDTATTAKNLIHELTKKEKKILDIIRNKSYEEISLVKSNNEEIKIRAKHKISGKFSDNDIIDLINKKSYQSVTVITDRGVKVAIIQEENIKV